MVCTFFGHRECPDLKPYIRAILEELIIDHHVDYFLVGNNGQFDRQVCSVLKQLSQEYPHILYGVVLAHMPGRNLDNEADHTILPEGIEKIHPKYSIDWRNRWMLKQSDYVVTHIHFSWGGAWKYASLANKQRKNVYNIDKDQLDKLPLTILQRVLANDAADTFPLPLDDLHTACCIVAQKRRDAGCVTDEMIMKARRQFEEYLEKYMD